MMVGESGIFTPEDVAFVQEVGLQPGSRAAAGKGRGRGGGEGCLAGTRVTIQLSPRVCTQSVDVWPAGAWGSPCTPCWRPWAVWHTVPEHTPLPSPLCAQAGCKAILVGEAIVKQGDPEAGVKKLLSLA